jgi:nucleoside-diphosphate-sugar epimerase
VKVLITGHRGFVGRHMVAALSGRATEVVGVDLVDGNDCRDFFRTDDTRFDLVVHLAAIVGGRQTIEGQPLKVATDLAIDSDMFQWALRTRPGHVVYYSSSAAYPVELQEPHGCQEGTFSWHGSSGDRLIGRKLTESDIDFQSLGRPDLTYGWAKLTGEMLAQHAEAEGLRVHVFRPFSGYGEDQDGSYPFGAFRDRARAKDDPFEIWGTGEQVRDFIHIDDVIAATLAAVEQDVPGPVNLCTGRATSFLELAESFMSAAGYRAPIRLLIDKPTGVQYRVGEPTKMLSFYQPRVSLEDGIRRALK